MWQQTIALKVLFSRFVAGIYPNRRFFRNRCTQSDTPRRVTIAVARGSLCSFSVTVLLAAHGKRSGRRHKIEIKAPLVSGYARPAGTTRRAVFGSTPAQLLSKRAAARLRCLRCHAFPARRVRFSFFRRPFDDLTEKRGAAEAPRNQGQQR